MLIFCPLLMIAIYSTKTFCNTKIYSWTWQNFCPEKISSSWIHGIYLWAIVMTVLVVNSLLMVSCMRVSVCRSMLAVASSMQITLASVSRARARHTSWRWPTEKTRPLSSTSDSKPPAEIQNHMQRGRGMCIFSNMYSRIHYPSQN